MVADTDLKIWKIVCLLSAVGTASLVTDLAYAEGKLYLVCKPNIDLKIPNSDQFRLSPDTADVLYRTSHHTRRGKLVVNDLEYRFIFKSTDEFWAQEWRVSRLTGEYIKETGNAPAFASSAENTTERGNCELLRGLKF